MLAACAMAPMPEASEKTPQQAIQPKNTTQIPRGSWLLLKWMARHIKSDPTNIIAPSTALRAPSPRFSIQVFSLPGAWVSFLPSFEGSCCSASAKATTLRSAPQARQNLVSSVHFAAHRGQYMTATSLFRPGEIERPGIRRAGEEADELLVVGASDPIEDAPVIFAEVYSPFEHHRLA